MHRKDNKFTPPQWSLKDIKEAMPPSVFKHNAARSIGILARDVLMALTLAWSMATLEPLLAGHGSGFKTLEFLVRSALWLLYWWFQGLVFTGIWVIGHECGHRAFCHSRTTCDAVGLICHTFLWTPYFSWRYTHQVHHQFHAHMEKDQHWIPQTRPEAGHSTKVSENILEAFSDTPLFTLIKLVAQQLFGFPLYLLCNVSGQKRYPKLTSHFNPFSILFKPSNRRGVLISDFALLVMAYLTSCGVSTWGAKFVFKLYGVPCLAVSHWITMIVLLQHTDARIPHYHDGSWNFTRGALATVDRTFLGWQGRFFLHDIAHFHTIHHFFPQMPFYHTEQATQHLKALIGRDYQSSDRSVFKCLWENMVTCQFVEDEGEVLFYRHQSIESL